MSVCMYVTSVYMYTYVVYIYIDFFTVGTRLFILICVLPFSPKKQYSLNSLPYYYIKYFLISFYCIVFHYIMFHNLLYW